MDDRIIPNETLPVKEERSTIIRVVHNRENPFVQLNKQALWDNTLSLKAVGLWARCMSRPNDWKFSIKELVNKCKEGRRSVDSAMQELIKANYACRLEYTERAEDGKFKNAGVEYVFFEFPATEEEKAEQLEIFKKSFRNCGFGNCRNGDSRNAHLLIKSLTEKEETTEKDNTPLTPSKPEPPALEPAASPQAAGAAVCEVVDSEPKKKRARTPSDFLPKVREVATKMINLLMEHNPVYRPPSDLTKFLSQVQLMLDRDKQDVELMLKTFEWGVSDTEQRGDFNGWQGVLCSKNPAETFRKHFAKIHSQMNARPKRKFAPSSNDKRSLEKFEQWAKESL